MKRIFMLVLVAMIAAFSIGIGVAVAEKPEGDNGGKPSDPPCDSNHGHPLENFIRQGRGDRCPTDDGDHGGNGGKPSDPPCDSNDGRPLENFIRQGRDDRCPTDDGGNGDDGNGNGNGDGNGDGNVGGDGGGDGDGAGQTTCSEDNDGDGEAHSALAPDNDETGLVSGIVHSVDRAGPIQPVTGDQSLAAEVNCALVAGLGL